MLEVRVFRETQTTGFEGSLTPDAYGANFNTVYNNTKTANYLTFDGQGVNLTDNNLKFFQSGDYTGYTFPYLSNNNGDIAFSYDNKCLVINPSGESNNYPEQISIQFKDDCCTELKVVYYKNGVVEGVNNFTVNGKHTTIQPKRYYDQIKIHFTKTKYPYQYVRLESVFFSALYVFNKFKQHSLIEEINVLSDDLPINEFEATILSPEGQNILKNDVLYLRNNSRYYGDFYVTDIKRTAPNVWTLKAQNLVGKLDKEEYANWISDDRSKNQLSNFVKELDDGIVIKTNDVYELFGYLPITTKRFALCAVGWACGLMVDGSRSNEIQLKEIPAKVTSTILTKDRRIIGEAIFEEVDTIGYANIKYPNQRVTEKREQTITLENTAGGFTHIFDDAPVKVTSRGSGNTMVYFSGDNYIQFNAENSSVTLTYDKYKYYFGVERVDNLKAFENGIYSDKSKDFKNFQLRGDLVDEQGQSGRKSRTADVQKFIESRGKVKAKIVLKGERVGDLIQIETAYDGVVTGIITKMEIHFGYEDVADIEVLEWSS